MYTAKKPQLWLKRCLFLFILIQPFLDTYFLYVPPVTDWIPFSPATIIRFILIAVVALLYLRSTFDLKQDRFALIYTVILLVYLGLHLVFTRNFQTINNTDMEYSVLGEIFYWIRMVIPLLTIYITYRVKITTVEFTKIISGLAWLISGSIVVSNLLNFSLASYGGGWIQGSIFKWFENGQHFSYFGLASKGFFYFANAISAVEVLLAPIVFYFLLKKPNVANYLLSLVQTLAMIMLGTKVASLGIVAIIVGDIFLYLIFSLWLKTVKFSKKSLFSLLSILLIGGAILPFSPMLNRTTTDVAVEQTQDGTASEIAKREEEMERERERKGKVKKETPLMRYIRKHYQEYSLNPQFVFAGYSYRDDPKFWYQVMKWPIGDRLNYRKVEKAMLKRAKTINNDPMNNWFGISYTRMNRIANLEQDFVSQWYSMGIFGVLVLLMPYVAVLVYCLVELIRNLRHQQAFFYTSLLFGTGMIVFLSLLSGNVMDFLTDTIILSFILGFMLAGARQRKLEVRS